MDDHCGSVPLGVTEPQKLWSLWDMIYTFKAGSLAESIVSLTGEAALMNFRQSIKEYDFERHCRGISLMLQALRSSWQYAPISPFLEGVWERCEERLASVKEQDAAVAMELLVQLRSGMVTYLELHTFLMLDSPAAALYEMADPFGAEVAAAFPDAHTDVREGTRCLALDQWTAAVFHLMRAAEYVLRRLAAEMGVENVERRDFGQLVQETRAKHDAISARDPVKQRSADALASLELFKDAWRNPVAHGRDHYDERRAMDVWNGVRAFMQSLMRSAP